MPNYETLFIADPTLGDQDVEKLIGRIGKLVGDFKGRLVKEEKWGRRKLAYPIKKKTEGSYVVLHLDLPASQVQEYRRNLRVDSHILRELTLRLD